MMMNLRDAIKRIGLIATGTAMSVSGIADAANITDPKHETTYENTCNKRECA